MAWAYFKNRGCRKVKMSLEDKRGGGNKKGRPRLKWRDDAELDLRNVRRRRRRRRRK